MSTSVPLFSDPCGQALTSLPFVSPSAGIRCHNAIRKVFGASTKQENVQIMLHLRTLNGATLLEMLANVVRAESEVLDILTGREVDSALAGLLHRAGSVTGNDGYTPSIQVDSDSDTDISSITLPSASPSLGPTSCSNDGLIVRPLAEPKNRESDERTNSASSVVVDVNVATASTSEDAASESSAACRGAPHRPVR